MSRFRFELADGRHDQALRLLFAQNEMEGEIALSFRREPSFFYSVALQGEFFQVIALRDRSTDEVIGVGTRAVGHGFVNGEPQPLGYLSDLRLDRRYRGGVLVARGYRYLEQLHTDGRTRLYLSVIAEGNRRALGTIASGRAGLPRYLDFGRLVCPAINLRRAKPELGGDFEIVSGSRALLPEIAACLRRNHCRRQFAPCYEEELRLLSANGRSPPRLRGLAAEDFRVALRRGKAIGVVAKWDQSAYKQTVVTGYRGKTRRIRPLYNFFAGAFGLPRYPRAGEQLRSVYASLVAIDEDRPEVFAALLRRLYNEQVGGSCHYLLVGLHERDPLAAALSDYTWTPFTARLFVVHFADGAELAARLDERVPYVELAAL